MKIGVVYGNPETTTGGNALGGLVMSIALANLWNRLNAATRQVSGDWIEKYI